MERSTNALLPKAPMVYAVISDPGIVDNPDIASYQPHVYGRCDPPALIPLQMNAIEMEIDCYLDTAFVTVSGTWRLHCITG
ncbi:inter-alpha-trypsin inhibitor heavy chain H3-like, partial [Trifolium medium]|nr:inter-alpha-trypsin inhibitor heavy chain H3-like [Trifolium medium]